MNENPSPQFPSHPEITPAPPNRSRGWGVVGLALTLGGVLLIATGGWMYLQQLWEAGKPPPARILDVSAADLEETLTPRPTATKVKPTPSPVPQLITKSQAHDTLIPTDTPRPEASTTPPPATATTTPTEMPTVTSTPTEMPTATPAQAEPEIVETGQEAPEDVLSLADNPLLVAEDNPDSDPVDSPPAPAAPNTTGNGAVSESSKLTRIQAESISLNADVIDVGWTEVEQNGTPINVWTVADYAAGWHTNSVLPGQGGNVVLSAHHNIKGEVFRYIVDLNPGDVVTLTGENGQIYNYAIEDKFIVKDKGEPVAVRQANAKWIGPFNDERLTLVTCWPYNNNTHRVIVIGKPMN